MQICNSTNFGEDTGRAMRAKLVFLILNEIWRLSGQLFGLGFSIGQREKHKQWYYYWEKKKGSTARRLLFRTFNSREFYEMAIEKKLIQFSTTQFTDPLLLLGFLDAIFSVLTVGLCKIGEGFFPFFHDFQTSGHMFCWKLPDRNTATVSHITGGLTTCSNSSCSL